MKKILLADCASHYPSNPLFLEALAELARGRGCEYAYVDEAAFFKSRPGSWVYKVVSRLVDRGPWVSWAYNRALIQTAQRFSPEVVLVVKGGRVWPGTLRAIKRTTGATLINYATDDPFNKAVTTRSLVPSIPLYDVYVCTKKKVMDDVRKAGGRKVVYLPFGYKPEFHFPEKPATADEIARFTSDVVFLGGADGDRLPYFETLVKRIPDLRLHLYGGYWERHPVLRRYSKGFVRGREYRLALGGTRIAINLVRRANRDGHVMRTFEIPACGAFMLAERTAEHLELFCEGTELACFKSPDEMAERVQYYLNHDREREQIAEAAHRRITSGANTYKDRLRQILELV